jgi:hypothetical protein
MHQLSDSIRSRVNQTLKGGQWVEPNPSNIRIFPTDICFYRLMVLR